MTRNAGSRLVYGKGKLLKSAEAFERAARRRQLCCCVDCCTRDPRRWPYRYWDTKGKEGRNG